MSNARYPEATVETHQEFTQIYVNSFRDTVRNSLQAVMNDTSVAFSTAVAKVTTLEQRIQIQNKQIEMQQSLINQLKKQLAEASRNSN